VTDFSPRKGMSERELAALVDAILVEASLAEKVAMMSGHGFFKAWAEDEQVWCARPYRAGGGLERLGVPALYFTDGPRGVAGGNSTCFPCSMARGATFDTDLERRIGEVMGIETRVAGCTLSGAVCMNLLRHPAWGRAQETYGEDPHHLGEMGAALAQGIQTHNVVATVKHLAVNSMENARFKVDVEVDERALHEVYLPHFKRAIDAGCASVMSAYNKMNGEYCGQNRVLLTDILRREWKFDGFVHSDWVLGVYHPYGASAGLDVENPEPVHFGKRLIAAVEGGAVEPEVIDRACRRILRVIYRFAAAEDPLEHYGKELSAAPAHVAVALEAAEKSAVLLKNEDVLPLRTDKIEKLAVLGRLAALENTGDEGSSRVRPPYVVTPLEGLRRAADRLEIRTILTGDEGDPDAAASAANAADAIVVVVGNTADDEGEFIPGDIGLGAELSPEVREQHVRPSRGGDRTRLNLRADQQALIAIAAASGKPVVVVIVAGSAIMVEEWHESVGAILQTFYSGMEGGTALARLLFGEISPSGKLPFVVARAEGDYPFFDKDANRITYDLWHGYTKLDRDAITPRYPFGHGLSYTQFAYRALKARAGKDAIHIQVTVVNEGDVAGDEVAQLYIGSPGRAVERPAKLLKAFTRVTLCPGKHRAIEFMVPFDDLRYRDPHTHDWRFEPGEYRILCGGSSGSLIETKIQL
jgi:beta-glucosidase